MRRLQEEAFAADRVGPGDAVVGRAPDVVVLGAEVQVRVRTGIGVDLPVDLIRLQRVVVAIGAAGPGGHLEVCATVRSRLRDAIADHALVAVGTGGSAGSHLGECYYVDDDRRCTAP